ncbi:DUF5681 domain-containing protein [Sneathiella sp.]|uniref:DUF5681 domain-containing protein n=1 Tax=Sneathiella sp. TaxID=1964365 RepID=UPI002628CAEF|nr:DUF5681 domain-containing protein [Sneathiella sp.]MDF2367765.1 DUF5681 domain-containing protein [Sneathiella sp.]
MTDRKEPDGNYEVGHGRPPKATRWKKGQSGNPKGRPKTERTGPLDISDILDKPVTMRINGKARQIHPFEGMVWQMVQQAMKGEITPLIRLVELCEEFGLIHIPPPEYSGSVIFAPKGMTPAEYVKQFADPVEEG